jgi:AcrR family transcriptional regulator
VAAMSQYPGRTIPRMVPATRDDGRRTRHEHRRGELLNAAVAYAVENGITDLSLRPLAAALGVSHKTLLYHFGTKEDLFTEIVHEWQAREQRLVLERSEHKESSGFFDLLRSAWDDLTAAGTENFLRFRFEVLGLAREQPGRYEDFLRSTYAQWPAIIESGLRTEGLPRKRARPLADLVLAAMHGLQLSMLNTGDRTRAENAFEELVNALRAVVATESARGARPDGTG